jgi:sugar phosphate isomerase/epimerase
MTGVSPGLCSVTFRELDAATVVDLCVETGLTAIEWAGDTHAPCGEITTATSLERQCADAGIEIASYGSYVCATTRDGDRTPVSVTPQDFSAALATAVALGAPNMRVWAGSRPSADTDLAGRRAVVTQLRDWSARAGTAGVALSVEYHRDTLTDSIESARQLHDEVDHPNLYAYWQAGECLEPSEQPDIIGQLGALRALLPHLSHLHVFWYRNWLERWPLAQGDAFWPAALAMATEPGRWPARRYALLEFVRDDEPDALREDAKALLSWIGESGGGNRS